MTTMPVEFRYETGLPTVSFTAASLTGSWTATGRPAAGPWSVVPMQPFTHPDGTRGFTATVELDEASAGETFSWGVTLEKADGSTAWGIFAETVSDQFQYRTFVLAAPGAVPQLQRYRLSWHRGRGAHRISGGAAGDSIRFACWAPNARSVEVVFGGASGYIADNGSGQDPALPLPMSRSSEDPEIWEVVEPDFGAFVGRWYMFRIERDDRLHVATDMFSREQCGQGSFDPKGQPYGGTPADLDGRPSCSEVIDPATVGPYPPKAGQAPQTETEFWADEHQPDKNVPRRVEDLVIYELHVGALNPESADPGTFADAIALLPYLESLGVNAVELMPMFQFDGTTSWGYGSTHFLAIESAAGGRDALKHFVRACHQHGIAVIMDVVYNHFDSVADRASWQYDSIEPHNNIYYWYDGKESDHNPVETGYVDNQSTGFAPRYNDEHVRALFISSAVCLLDEFHIDGLRVDQVTAIKDYNVLHTTSTPVPLANEWGRKFLRELCQTIKTVWPDSLLIAEDHSHWAPVTEPAVTGGSASTRPGMSTSSTTSWERRPLTRAGPSCC